MKTIQIRLPVWLFLVPAIAAGCGRSAPPIQGGLSAAVARELVSKAVKDSQGVVFGDRFQLLGVVLTPKPEGLALDAVWKGLVDARREFLVPVHFVDGSGKILAQADYPQDPENGPVGKGAHWHESILIPYEKLVGAQSIAMGLMFKGREDWLLLDKGPSDWGRRRLLLGIPSNLPVQGAQYDGYLDLADCTHLTGWAWDVKDPSATVTVEVVEGNRVVARGTADRLRPDLKTAGIGTGQYGFLIPTPPELLDKKNHSILVRVVGASAPLKNGLRELRCP